MTPLKMSPEMRALIVSNLARALVTAFRKKPGSDGEPGFRDRDEGRIGERPTAVLETPSPAGV